jgi:hypothetical protein
MYLIKCNISCNLEICPSINVINTVKFFYYFVRHDHEVLMFLKDKSKTKKEDMIEESIKIQSVVYREPLFLQKYN